MPDRIPCRDCHRMTSTETAIQGYGPKCARKHGLTVTRIRVVAAPAAPQQPAEPADDHPVLFELEGAAA